MDRLEEQLDLDRIDELERLCCERDMARKVFSEHRETLRSRELAAVAEEAI